MGNLFGDIKPILKDDMPLREAFIPERMLHREGELRQLASCVKPLIHDRQMRNVFLYGPTGTGKTTMVHHIFDLLKEETSKVVTAYVNCWKQPTTNAILNSIYREVNRSKAMFIHKKTTTELLEELEKEVEKTNKKLIVALDEIDKIEDMNVLYSLSRSNYGLILISNDPFALKELDSRIRSSLSLETIEFRAYTTEEMFDILKDRVDYAFYPNSISDAMIKLVALNSEGDARVGLEILRRAALIAEDEESEKVEREHVLKAIRGAKNIKSSQIMANQPEELKLLFKILEEKGELSSSSLLQEFNERYLKTQGKTISERTFRKYMQKLTNLKVVVSEGDVRWRRYRIV